MYQTTHVVQHTLIAVVNFVCPKPDMKQLAVHAHIYF